MKTIKERKQDALLIAIIVGVFVALMTSIYLKDKANTRTTTGVYNNGTIITTDNNVWKVSNYNGISTKGTHKVTVKFDTKGTDSVLDDEIVEITEIR